MNFNDAFLEYLERLNNMKSQLKGLTEESTKMALVVPFISMLGYDVFNATEVVPEYTCDVATKKGEKVDYAILKDSDPIMLIEVKRAGSRLQKQQQGQLFRYFSTNRCRIAILTNGIVYQFFSDLNAPNIMDDEPFLSFNLLEDDPTLFISSVHQFCKDRFNVKNVISKAIFQKYSKVVQKTLKEDLLNPSDEIVKYFLSRPEIKTGNRITSQMIDKYREATKNAMQKVFNVVINSSDDYSNHQDSNLHDRDTNNQKESIATVSNDPVAPEKTPELLLQDIQTIVKNLIPNCTWQQENLPDLIKLHIYTNDNRKYGIIKIQIADMAIQFRKLINGMPEVHEIQSLDDLTNYFK